MRAARANGYVGPGIARHLEKWIVAHDLRPQAPVQTARRTGNFRSHLPRQPVTGLARRDGFSLVPIFLASVAQGCIHFRMEPAGVVRPPPLEGATAGSRTYREFAPGPALAASVECFWTSTVRGGRGGRFSHQVLPDGCMDLLFDFKAAAGLRAGVIGAMTRPLTVTTDGPLEMLGIRFRPGGISRFVRLDAAELTDSRAELTHFWGRFAADLCDQLCEAPEATRVAALQNTLVARANGGLPVDPYIRHCVARIEEARGSLRIGELEKSTGLSARQLERKFAAQLGISPKAFARVVRFKGVAAAAAKTNAPDWATLAYDFGFADQAHLAREFKAYSGQTPTDFWGSIGDRAGDVGFLQDLRAALD